jgi:hypothetical protein
MHKILSMILLSGMITVATQADTKYELGLGANSALIGVTANFEVQEKTELFAGAGLGVVAGVRYYFSDEVRANVSYGTQGYAAIENRYKDDTSFEHLYGANVGFDYDFGDKDGWMAGLLYNVTTNFDDVIDEYEKKGYNLEKVAKPGLKLALAYRY